MRVLAPRGNINSSRGRDWGWSSIAVELEPVDERTSLPRAGLFSWTILFFPLVFLQRETEKEKIV
jgi:hypothetical protein